MGWYHQRSPHTRAYDEYLLRQLRGSTVADVSLKERIGYDAIIGSLERQVSDEVAWDTIKRLDSVGIDEIATCKGHKGYRAVITARQDDGQLHVLAVSCRIEKKTVSAFLDSIPARLRPTQTGVASSATRIARPKLARSRARDAVALASQPQQPGCRTTATLAPPVCALTALTSGLHIARRVDCPLQCTADAASGTPPFTAVDGQSDSQFTHLL